MLLAVFAETTLQFGHVREQLQPRLAAGDGSAHMSPSSDCCAGIRLRMESHLDLGLAREALREGGVSLAAGAHRVQLVHLLRQWQQLQNLRDVPGLNERECEFLMQKTSHALMADNAVKGLVLPSPCRCPPHLRHDK